MYWTQIWKGVVLEAHYISQTTVLEAHYISQTTVSCPQGHERFIECLFSGAGIVYFEMCALVTVSNVCDYKGDKESWQDLVLEDLV